MLPLRLFPLGVSALLFSSSLIVPAPLCAQPVSDLRLEGRQLAHFLKSEGATALGRDVCWSMPCSTFKKPLRTRKGHALFVYKKIGLVVSLQSADLAEVRRRGTIAWVRGRVIRTPPKRRKKNDPEYCVIIREIRAR